MTQKHIPLNYTRVLARVLDLKEREVGKLLAKTDLKPEELYQTDCFLSSDEQLQILRNVLDLFPDQCIGLKVGSQMNPISHGPMGYLALSSPDLKSALIALADYLPSLLGFVDIIISEDKDWLYCDATFSVDVDSDIEITVLEIFILTVQSVVESVSGQILHTSHTDFHYPRPKHANMYSDYLHTGYSFDNERTRYKIPAPLGKTPNINSDHQNFAFAKQQCETLLSTIKPQQKTVTEKVKALLINRPQVLMSEEEAAERLLISSRSLARRLIKEGTSFRKLRDETLAELSARYLSNEKLSVEVIAELLGYHDSASFRRAFKRWYGMTPKAFRDQM